MAKLDFDSYMEKLAEMWLILNQYRIEVGVFSQQSKRKNEIIAISNGISNAELMFIHENGSPLRNIPRRPVLEMSIEYAIKKIVPLYLNKIEKDILNDKATKQSIKMMLEQMCMEIQSYAQQLIYKNDGRLQRNAKSTIERKGFNHPLFNTGALARSITCQLVENTSF